MYLRGDKIIKFIARALLALVVSLCPAAWSASVLGQEFQVVAREDHEGQVMVRLCRLANDHCQAVGPADGLSKEQWHQALKTDRGLARMRSGLKGALLVSSVGLGGWLSWIGGLARWIGGSVAFAGAGAVADGSGVGEFLARDDLRHQALVVLFDPANEVYSGFDDTEVMELVQFLSLVAAVEKDIRTFQLGELQVP